LITITIALLLFAGVLLFEQRFRVIPNPEEVFAPLQKRRVRIRRYVRVHVVVSQPRRGVLRRLSERRFRLHHGLFDVRFVIFCGQQILDYVDISETINTRPNVIFF